MDRTHIYLLYRNFEGQMECVVAETDYSHILILSVFVDSRSHELDYGVL